MKPLLCLLTLSTLALAQPPGDVEAVVTTDMGTFRFEFAPDKAPKHVEQFIRLAKQGFYNGSAFHRVIANGIVQGGDPLLKDPKTPKNLWGTGGLNMLPDEFSDLKHERGVVSAVRIPDKPNSDGSQFFVCVFPQPPLDGKFSAFGRVTEGIDVVEKISRVPAGENGFTNTPVRIQSVTIEKKKTQPFVDATLDELRRISATPIDANNSHYRLPLDRDLLRLRERAGSETEVILLVEPDREGHAVYVIEDSGCTA